MPDVEYKTLRRSVKSIDGRTVIGIAAVHGNVDSGGDKSWPGAFGDMTVNGRDRVVFLWQHDSMQPPTAQINYLREVPRSELPPAVLDYAPDATGGLEISRTYLATPRGDEILAGITAGAIGEMSYAYAARQYDYEEIDGRTIRNLRMVDLYDVSDVTWGMNPATVGSKAIWKDRPLIDHADYLEGEIACFAERCAENYERRAKAGRTFSQANMDRMNSIADAIAEALDSLRKLMRDAEPAKQQQTAIDARKLLMEYERTIATIGGMRL